MSGGAKSGTWIGGAAFVSVIIVLLGWFLVISPQRARVSDANEQKATVEVNNATLESEIGVLKDQFSHIDEYKAEMAALDLEIPSVRGSAALNREVAALADSSGVILTAVTINPAVAVVPAAAPAATPAATDQTATDDASASPSASPSASASDAAATPNTAVAPVEGLASMEVSITVVGPYANSQTFLAGLRTTLQRYFLVTGLSLTSTEASEGGSGKPKTERGDLESIITGLVFTLPQVSSSVTPDPAATTAPTLPNGDRNPIPPVVGK